MEYTGPSEKRIQNDKLSFEIHFFRGFSPRKNYRIKKKTGIENSIQF